MIRLRPTPWTERSSTCWPTTRPSVGRPAPRTPWSTPAPPVLPTSTWPVPVHGRVPGHLLGGRDGSTPGHDLASPAFQNVTVVADETVTVTFVNPRQRGAIEITKTRKHAATAQDPDPHPGVTFTVRDSEGNVVTGGTVVTDANGEACVDGLLFGTYSVTETVPAGYVADGATTQNATVDNQADCLAAAASRSPLRTPRSPTSASASTRRSSVGRRRPSTVWSAVPGRVRTSPSTSRIWCPGPTPAPSSSIPDRPDGSGRLRRSDPSSRFGASGRTFSAR